MPTAQDYDAVPYEDCPLIQTKPDNLGLIATLFGINAAAPDNCKVLELGCASGGNIIPLAYYWPNSKFTGIELSANQAATGNRLIEELELTNINIIQKNILDLDRNLGSFDYIIAHGVYSWVPAEVQHHILKLIPEILAPNGVAFISYNTFPGWHFRMAVRDIMLHPSQADTPAEKKRDNGIAMLHKLATGLPDSNSLSEKWLKKEAELLLTLPPSYLLHDYLEENNNPEYFYQFMEKAQANNLQFVSEADMYTMIGSTLTEQAEKDLDEIEDLIEYQQYLDFYYVRFFRQTLLCHDNLEVNYDLDVEKITDCYFIALLNCAEEIDLHSDTPQPFTHPNGESFDISHPLTKAATVALSYQYPNAYSWTELQQAATDILTEHKSAFKTANSDDMLQELFNLFLSQGIELSQADREFSATVTETPKANRLAQVYAKHKRCCIGTMHHGNISLDDIDQYLLTLLDGIRTTAEIEEAVAQKIKTDSALQVSLLQQGKDPNTLLESLNSKIEQSLYFFALNGLLDNS
ncbi:methyltransferase regulatory domain-containing protein [Kaarinaea lacus]